MVSFDSSSDLNLGLGLCLISRTNRTVGRFGTIAKQSNFLAMIRQSISLAALAGSLFLFEPWLSQHEKQKGVERLQHYEIPRVATR